MTTHDLRTKRRQIRVGVRSGAAARHGNGDFPRVKVAVVFGGSRPMLWLGSAREYEGLAWICGRDTLRKLRDALDEVLKEENADG